ncbi:MAG: hypothetical protein IJ309_01585 [Clostridia bacterium]|nr:hypothetical protein [Clostridia bacterium]
MAFDLTSKDENARPRLAKFIDNFTSNNFQSAYKITYGGNSLDSHRYRSWEHCRQRFINARGTSPSQQEKEELALHLAFYLASWGMYRGSSFLLSLDYTVHLPVVDIALKNVYDKLFQSDSLIVQDQKKYLTLMFGEDGKGGIVGELRDYLALWRNEVKRVGAATTEDEGEDTALAEGSVRGGFTLDDVSTVLITKILMGVFGCIPAYDRYVMDGLGVQGIQKTFNKKGVGELLNHVVNDEKVYNNINDVRSEMIKANQGYTTFDLNNYTFMKMVDMLFWEIGAGQVVEVSTRRGASFDEGCIGEFNCLVKQVESGNISQPPYTLDAGCKRFKSSNIGSLLMCVCEELKDNADIKSRKTNIKDAIKNLRDGWLATVCYTKKFVK